MDLSSDHSQHFISSIAGFDGHKLEITIDSAASSSHVIRPGDFYVEKVFNRFRVNAGYQVISWGESFAFNPVDIINPVVSESIFETDVSRQKASSPLLSLLGTFENVDVSFILGATSPQNINDTKEIFGFNQSSQDTVSFKSYASETLEPVGAIKPAILIADKVDLSVFGAFHGARTPYFELESNSDGIFLRQVPTTNLSYGGGFSTTILDTVLRGDAIHTRSFAPQSQDARENENQNDIDKNTAKFEYKNKVMDRSDISAGMDQTFFFGNTSLTLGAQVNQTTIDLSNQDTQSLNLLGFQALADFSSTFSVRATLFGDVEDQNSYMSQIETKWHSKVASYYLDITSTTLKDRFLVSLPGENSGSYLLITELGFVIHI